MVPNLDGSAQLPTSRDPLRELLKQREVLNTAADSRVHVL